MVSSIQEIKTLKCKIDELKSQIRSMQLSHHRDVKVLIEKTGIAQQQLAAKENERVKLANILSTFKDLNLKKVVRNEEPEGIAPNGSRWGNHTINKDPKLLEDLVITLNAKLAEARKSSPVITETVVSKRSRLGRSSETAKAHRG
eukprot:TRINITY_DN6444_c0_g1_i1.p1 TRINITY_DN6444_c0_g1~~TRINITY_DN6444_c0_g1_i1.p1  ORF type:complete len:145 (-),score=39.80 TRINITY_DN6444_c0_g1_i1:2-436(-)